METPRSDAEAEPAQTEASADGAAATPAKKRRRRRGGRGRSRRPATAATAEADAGETQPPDPTGGQSPYGALVGGLMQGGGLILHGEQEFEYRRPIQVGDVLVGEGKILDIYEKESKGAVMTFIVVETAWRDEASGEAVVTERFNLIARLKR